MIIIYVALNPGAPHPGYEASTSAATFATDLLDPSRALGAVALVRVGTLRLARGPLVVGRPLHGRVRDRTVPRGHEESNHDPAMIHRSDLDAEILPAAALTRLVKDLCHDGTLPLVTCLASPLLTLVIRTTIHVTRSIFWCIVSRALCVVIRDNK